MLRNRSFKHWYGLEFGTDSASKKTTNVPSPARRHSSARTGAMTTWRFSRRNNDPPQVKTSDYPEKATVGLSSALRTHVSSFRYRHNGTRGTPPRRSWHMPQNAARRPKAVPSRSRRAATRRRRHRGPGQAQLLARQDIRIKRSSCSSSLCSPRAC